MIGPRKAAPNAIPLRKRSFSGEKDQQPPRKKGEGNKSIDEINEDNLRWLERNQRTLFIGSLPFQCTEQEIRSLDPFREVVEFKISVNPQKPHENMGYMHIEFRDTIDLDTCKKEIESGFMFKGRKLVVQGTKAEEKFENERKERQRKLGFEFIPGSILIDQKKYVPPPVKSNLELKKANEKAGGWVKVKAKEKNHISIPPSHIGSKPRMSMANRLAMPMTVLKQGQGFHGGKKIPPPPPTRPSAPVSANPMPKLSSVPRAAAPAPVTKPTGPKRNKIKFNIKRK